MPEATQLLGRAQVSGSRVQGIKYCGVLPFQVKLGGGMPGAAMSGSYCLEETDAKPTDGKHIRKQETE